MKCKICGMPLIGSAPQVGSFVITSTCNCGMIRKRERAKGCSNCGITITRSLMKDEIPEIQVEYKQGVYAFKCTNCGHEWTVTE